MVGIVIKNYEHFNRSFPNWDTPKGVYIKTKDQYDRLMKENNMISYEEMQRRAEHKNLKEYKISEESKAIIQAAKASKDKKGNVKLSDKTIDMLIKKKAIGNKIPDNFNINNKSGGGFTLDKVQKEVYSSTEKAQGFSL